MTGDSLDFVGAVLLFAASCFCLRARGYLRFAVALFAALSAAMLMGAHASGLGSALAFLVLPPGGVALALFALARIARPVPHLAASVALAAALICGFVALLFGPMTVALAPFALAGLSLLTAALLCLDFVSALSGLLLLASASAFAARGAHGAMPLFLGAALFGLAQLRVSKSVARAGAGALS